MKKLCAFFAAICMMSGSAVFADQVILNNGDKLTGKIIGLGDGKLTINTAAAGDVKLDAKDISTFSTDAPVSMVLTDGTALSQKIVTAAPGEVKTEGGLLGAQEIHISDVDTINAPAAVWAGEIKAGALLVRGNSFSDSLNLGVHVSRTTKQDMIAFNGDYLYGRTKNRFTNTVTTTQDNWGAELTYDYNFTKKFYGVADVAVSKDRLAALDLRVVPSVGVGYKWFDDADFKFATEAAIAWDYEQYTNNTPKREQVSARLAYHLLKNFNDKVSLFHDFTYLPSIENISVYVIDTDLGLRSMMTKHLFSEFKFVLDYDSQPADFALKTNLRYELSIGYKL